MTRKEQLTYCKVCTNKKFNPQNGFVCGLTDKVAEFEGSCESFQQSNDTAYIDTSRIEHNPGTSTLSALITPSTTYTSWSMFFFSILLLNAVSSVFFYFFGFDTTELGDHWLYTLLLVADTTYCIGFFGLVLYALFCFYKKKSNAIFIAKITLYSILVISLLSSFIIPEKEFIRSVAFSIFWLLFLYFSPNLKEVFPPKERKIQLKDKIIAPIIFAPMFVSLIVLLILTNQ